MEKQVPFFANTADDTHCVQAAFRSMLGYFLPERSFSWRQLDAMTAKIPGKGTWWFPILAEIANLGLKSKVIESFDYQKFYDQGENYVREVYKPEVAHWYIKSSNLLQVRHLVPGFIKNAKIEKRAANLSDIENLLAAGWLVGLDVNARALNGRSGFSSHMVVIFGKIGQDFLLHDPGLPPRPRLKVHRQLLLKSWGGHDPKNRALVAIKASK